MNMTFQTLKRRLRRIFKRRSDRREHILNLIAKDSVCAEIGVWKGTFSQRILERHPARLHLIDPWLYLPGFGDRVYGKRGDNSQGKMDEVYESVRARFGRSPSVVLHRSTSEEAVTGFQDSYFNFIYIDGNHDYDFVKKDIELYLPKVKEGGYITGDDYVFDRCPQGGPKRAVEEIVALGLVKLVSVKNNQFVLQKIQP